MLRSISAMLLAVAISDAAANAASLSVSADKLTYLIGETVTLTVTGDNEGAAAYGIYGRLDYSGALVDNGVRSQIGIVTDSGPWVKGPLSAADDGINAYSEAFNQLTLYPDPPPSTLPAPISTVTLIATALGILNVDWHTAVDPYQLYFFGLPNAPGTSFTIVPEPATAALLGLGLTVLAFNRRRSRPRDA